MEWDAGYEDLPNRLIKVEVPDRMMFVTFDAERKLSSPEGLQGRVDEAVQKVDMGRSFVRPSGTEDCVRVYSEAKTTAEADGTSTYTVFVTTFSLICFTALAQTVADLVRHAAGLI